MSEEIAVIVEVAEGRPAPVARELIAFAKAIRKDKAGGIRLLVPGRGIEGAAGELAEIPGVAVTGIAGAQLAAYSAEAWKLALTPLLAALKPRLVLIAHDARGADYAPGLAVRLGAACITAVETFRREEGRVIFSRSVLKGKLKMEIAPEAEMAVVTLLPGTFSDSGAHPFTGDGTREWGTPAGAPGKGSPVESSRAGEIPPPKTVCPVNAAPEGEDRPAAPNRPQIIPLGNLDLKTRPLGIAPAPDSAADLAAAEVIVAAGRGIGNEGSLALISQLASLFSHSAVGASRALCDVGWLPYRCQIGQTGATVSPRLYIACGISGAVQHLAGMRGSQCIVAINRDPQAAVFRAAHIAVVEELGAFLPLVIDESQNWREPAGDGRS